MADFMGVMLFRIIMLGIALLALVSFLGIEIADVDAIYLSIFCAAISAFFTIERDDHD